MGVECILMCMGCEFVGGCNIVATLNMAGRVRLACMQKLWSA